jgi:hypothetical protein
MSIRFSHVATGMSVVTALSAIIGFYVFAHAQNAHCGAAKATHAWEYQVVVMADVVIVHDEALQDTAKARVAIESKFNELGRDGWEYCGEIPGGVVFKRSRP